MRLEVLLDELDGEGVAADLEAFLLLRASSLFARRWVRFYAKRTPGEGFVSKLLIFANRPRLLYAFDQKPQHRRRRPKSIKDHR